VNNRDWQQDLQDQHFLAQFAGEFRELEPLAKHTYYRIGGPARALFLPKTTEDLIFLARWIQEKAVPFQILGLGSNYLVSDQGYEGVVIKLTRINLGIESQSTNGLTTGASVAVSTLLRKAALEGWGGLEFLAGIPGSIGGVIAMNAGTHLGEAKDRVKSVSAVQIFGEKAGELIEYTGTALQFEYRKNLFLPQGAVVTHCVWNIEPTAPSSVKQSIDETLARRKASQPVDFPSCGSVFKNPRAFQKHAWQVIDQVGLRGHRIGDAQISEKHSNFIVNLGAASAQDVRALIDLAKRKVLDELGIPLEEEVKFLGQF
jgi:UDP-N-acetylmuramate dehydrogenase